MNFASLLSAPLPTSTSSILGSTGLPTGSSAGTQAGLHLPGVFDALVSASAVAIDAPATASPLLNLPLQIVSPETSKPASGQLPVAEVVKLVSGKAAKGDSAQPMPTEFAVLSAATIEMLSALDRSATMLSQPQTAAPVAAPTQKDEKPVPTEPTSPAAEGSIVPSPQTAALIASLLVVGRALPTIVATSDEEPKTTATAPLATSAPKTALPTPQAAAATVPSLFNAIASEMRPMIHAKAEIGGKSVDASSEPVEHSPEGLSVVSPASAMIRDLASVIADSATPTAPTDGVAVDRHLDLALGDAWLNDLANDIAATAANGGRLKFGLAPESLGRLDVEIRQGEAGVSVHMTTRTDTARDLLTAAQPRIVDEIRAQGVRVAGTEVSTDASGFGGDRAGDTPRQSLAMPIEAALAAPDAVPPETPESVADGRYA